MIPSHLGDRIDHIKRRLAALDDGCGDAAPDVAAALERFEARAKVRLPEEYRAFLSSIRRLPAIVPFYGMVPPGHPADDTDKSLPIAHLAESFPFVETWMWEDDPEIDRPPEDWTPQLQAKWEARKHGILWLGTDGCAHNFALVVTGKKRGEVWGIADVGLGREEPGGASFLDWLQHRIGQFAADKGPLRNPPRFPAPWSSYL
jgi:hypothetical protein